jgi:hypothetical protein
MRTWFLPVAFGAALSGLGTACSATVDPPERSEEVASTSSAICSGTTTLSSNASNGDATVGATVTWTATASCDMGDTPTYQFWEETPSGSWSIVQDYGTSPTYQWVTTGDAVGDYNFEVWVRAQGSSAKYESYASAPITLTDGAACSSVSAAFSPAMSATVGATVTVTGSAMCGGTPTYQFWEQPPVRGVSPRIGARALPSVGTQWALPRATTTSRYGPEIKEIIRRRPTQSERTASCRHAAPLARASARRRPRRSVHL